jgi:hypothetical protein
MKSVLEQLYKGEITPRENQPREKMSEPHRNLCDEVLKALDGNLDLYDKLIDSYYENEKDFHFCGFEQGNNWQLSTVNYSSGR